MRPFYLVVISLFALSKVLTQTPNWFAAPALQLNGSIAGNVDFFIGAEPEYDFDAQRMGQLDLSGGASFKVGELRLTGSVVYRRKWPSNKGHEWRFWQQISHQFKAATWRIRNRIRIEERFDRRVSDASYHGKQRIRYRLAFDTPLQGERLDAREWYLNLSGELLFDDVFDQNQRERELRYYLGLGYQFLQGNRLEPAIDYRFSKEADGRKQAEGLFRLTYIMQIQRSKS